MTIEYLTIEKKESLEKELEYLKTTKRKEIADVLEWAKSLGDLSENAEYSQARDEQAKCESRIAEIEEILQNAIIQSDEHHNDDIVDIGDTVTVSKINGEEKVFTIVGREEIDLTQNKISNESPIGMALIGRKKGESVDVNTPNGIVTYKIIKVV